MVQIVYWLLVLPLNLHAQYPAAKPNMDLRQEIETQTDRLVPQYKYFVGSVDGQGYHRFTGANDFYHGTGYWLQTRVEIEPHENFRVNLRSIFFSGNSSAGYAAPIGFYNFLSLAAELPYTFLGGDVTGRVLDLGRQTVGRGLLIQEREFFGGLFAWEKNGHRVFLRGTGTGAIIHDDDTYNFEISLFRGLLGLGALHFGEKNRDGYQFLYSTQQLFEGFSYDLEAGVRRENWAGLLALNYRLKTSSWQIDTRLEGRLYEDGFGDQLVGDIDQDYVSYDQLDKSYSNPINFLITDDALFVYALKFDVDYKPNDYLRLHLNSDVGVFEFENFKDDEFYFYRYGLAYFPLEQREENLVLFVSNKILTESFTIPPNMVSKSNTPMFSEYNYLGLEANFRF